MKNLKNLLTNNFTTLSPRLFDLNQNCLKVMASYEDGEGGFCDPEIICDSFNNVVDEDAVNSMIESIEAGYLEVESKKEGSDYIVTAGSNEVVYVIRLQIFRIA